MTTGILSQAQGSKDSTLRAEEKEKIQLEVLASYETDGILSIEKLKSNIENYLKEATHDGANSFPLTVTYVATGHAYKVEGDGNVKSAKPKPKISSYKIVNSYGTEITEEAQVENGELYIIITPTIENGTIETLTCNEGNTTQKQNDGTYKVTVTKNGEYTFTIVGRVNGETSTTNSEKVEVKCFKVKTAESTLKVDSSATSSVQKSPYVKYTYKKKIIDENEEIQEIDDTIICRVLYDSEDGYGIQIISTKPVENVGMGSIDEYATGSTDFEKAKDSYNNMIVHLNKYAEKYLYGNNVVSSARCVGSNPINPNKDESGYFIIPDSLSSNYNDTGRLKINGIFKDSDTNFTTDESQLKALGMYNCIGYPIKQYYLASRNVLPQSNNCCFQTRCINDTGGEKNYILCRMDAPSGKEVAGGQEYGIRPVFTLKSNVKITGGDGLTPETGYTLGL